LGGRHWTNRQPRKRCPEWQFGLSPNRGPLIVEVDGVPIRYQVRGQGRPLVLVHGLAGSTAWWVRNVPALSRRHTVFLVDLPGFGSMRKYRSQFSVTGAAHWLAALLTALKIEKAAMLGHSMGGLITALLAAQCPQMLDRIVLAAPAIGLPHRTLMASLLPLARGATYIHPHFFPTLVKDSIRSGLFTLLRAGRELLSIDVTRELERIVSPVLLVWGQNDPLVPVTLSRSLQTRLHNSRLCVLPGAGHILMYDRADEFNRVVLNFLSGPAS
jgi:pimeloyl-ACP methyl ester carboxylesterase